jgi:hypothetical protein
LSRRSQQEISGQTAPKKGPTEPGKKEKRHQQKKSEPVSRISELVADVEPILAESGCSTSDEESSGDEMDTSENLIGSTQQQSPPVTISLWEPGHNDFDGNWPRISSPPNEMGCGLMPPHSEAIIEEDLFREIRELEPLTWNLDEAPPGTAQDQGISNPSCDRLNSQFATTDMTDVRRGDEDIGRDDIGLPRQIYSVPADEEMPGVCFQNNTFDSPMAEDDSGSASTEKITLTMDNPSAETMASLMRVALANNSPFRFERH